MFVLRGLPLYVSAVIVCILFYVRTVNIEMFFLHELTLHVSEDCLFVLHSVVTLCTLKS